MSFRARIAIAAAAAVALAVVLGSAISYAIVRNELRGEVDHSLQTRAASMRLAVHSEPGGCQLIGPGPSLGEVSFAVQLVQANGQTCQPPVSDYGPLPVSGVDRLIAKGAVTGDHFRDSTVDGKHVRVLTEPVYGADGSIAGAIQVFRSLGEVDHTLSRLRLLLLAIALGGVGIAAALGLLVARAALRPVRSLTETAETVTETGDLSQRIEVMGRDELSRLATSFNTMLAALEDSTRAQRQLVADASHELRTPLTSLRTNIEVLASDHALPPEDRSRLLSDVVEQLGEMTTLIAELIELARAEQQPAEPEDIRLDLVAGEALERSRRNHPEVVFTADLDPSVVQGVSSTIERAIGNLLDNAAKWSAAGGEVSLEVRDGAVSVRDHGPGIAEEDLPYVFDRFYRARSARRMPGSGLGLAIVKQVAEAHGGEVAAERAEGGGTRVTLRLDGRTSGAPDEPVPEDSLVERLTQ
jgi:two-component system sensor histidine kinase MprB